MSLKLLKSYDMRNDVSKTEISKAKETPSNKSELDM